MIQLIGCHPHSGPTLRLPRCVFLLNYLGKGIRFDPQEENQSGLVQNFPNVKIIIILSINY